MKKFFTYSIAILILTLSFFFLFKSIYLGSDQITGRVVKVVSLKESEEQGAKLVEEKLEILLSDGKTVEVETEGFSVNVITHSEGDSLLLQHVEGSYYILDFYRLDGIILLAFVFAIISVLIAGKGGLLSLISMGFSFLVIFKYLLPSILDGKDPVSSVIIAAIVIIPITFYLSHGFNIKTTISIIGTIITLLFVGFISKYILGALQLNGLESEEAFFLNLTESGQINMQGLMLAGIIIGLLGILDDVTVSQVNTVLQLHQVNRSLSTQELFSRAISVGRDHIASTINTLVLVYTGASFPLLLIFLGANANAWEIINQEFIAAEIIKTLVGSIGLILAIPIVTTIAVYWCKKTGYGQSMKDEDTGYHIH